MAFFHNLAELAFFVAPAMAVTLSDQEKGDLATLHNMLARRKSELALLNAKPSLYSARIKQVKADIIRVENVIADYRHIARTRF